MCSKRCSKRLRSTLKRSGAGCSKLVYSLNGGYAQNINQVYRFIQQPY